MENLEKLPSPSFVCEEKRLRKNLELLKHVQDEAGVKILLALKGFALWSTFDLCKEYLQGCCASGLNEALLAKEEFGKEVHTYSPAFKEDEMDEILEISNHVVFNSFAQFQKYKEKAVEKPLAVYALTLSTPVWKLIYTILVPLFQDWVLQKPTSNLNCLMV